MVNNLFLKQESQWIFPTEGRRREGKREEWRGRGGGRKEEKIKENKKY